MSGSRGVPGSSTSPGSDEGIHHQAAATAAGAAAAAAPAAANLTTIVHPLQRLHLLQQQVPAPALDPTIKSRLVANGERERLKRLLAERLEQCGWRDQLTAAAAALLASRDEEDEEEERRKKSSEEEGEGRDALPSARSTTTTSTQLAAALTPAAQAAVPDSVKAELLTSIRASVLSA